MTVNSATSDPENLTLTLVAEFDAKPEQVWGAWEDPRTLERWWGPVLARHFYPSRLCGWRRVPLSHDWARWRDLEWQLANARDRKTEPDRLRERTRRTRR